MSKKRVAKPQNSTRIEFHTAEINKVINEFKSDQERLDYVNFLIHEFEKVTLYFTDIDFRKWLVLNKGNSLIYSDFSAYVLLNIDDYIPIKKNSDYSKLLSYIEEKTLPFLKVESTYLKKAIKLETQKKNLLNSKKFKWQDTEPSIKFLIRILHEAGFISKSDNKYPNKRIVDNFVNKAGESFDNTQLQDIDYRKFNREKFENLLKILENYLDDK